MTPDVAANPTAQNARSGEIVAKSHRITPQEQLEAIQLYEKDNLTISAIAAKLGRDRETISRALDGFIDSQELARKWLAGNALELAKDWTEASKQASKKGYHNAAKEGLLHLGVIDPVQDTGSGTRVNIMIGAPGAPVPYPAMVIEQPPK